MERSQTGNKIWSTAGVQVITLYRPSIFGAVASVIFFVLALVEISNRQWLDVLAWTLLGVAFALSVIPRNTFGSRTALVAGLTLGIGAILFLLDAAEKLT